MYTNERTHAVESGNGAKKLEKICVGLYFLTGGGRRDQRVAYTLMMLTAVVEVLVADVIYRDLGDNKKGGGNLGQKRRSSG